MKVELNIYGNEEQLRVMTAELLKLGGPQCNNQTFLGHGVRAVRINHDVASTGHAAAVVEFM